MGGTYHTATQHYQISDNKSNYVENFCNGTTMSTKVKFQVISDNIHKRSTNSFIKLFAKVQEINFVKVEMIPDPSGHMLPNHILHN
jgi:hypothetical protein